MTIQPIARRVALIAASAALLTACTATAVHRHQTIPVPPPQSGGVGNLDPASWQYLPGGVPEADGLRILPADFHIVTQAGAAGEANPPVDLYGPHLETTGDFEVTASMSDIVGNAAVQLYDTPPVIADEFRVEPASLRIVRTPDALRIEAWDGTNTTKLDQQLPFYDHSYPLASSTQTKLDITKVGKDVTVTANGQVMGTVAGTPLFKSGNVWLGADSSAEGYVLNSMTAVALGTSKLSIVSAADAAPTALEPNGIQALASKVRPGFQVGAALAPGPLFADSSYAQQALGNFGRLTPENAMKWQNIEPQPGMYTFQGADALVDKAIKEGITVQGHTLVFSEANPIWVNAMSTSTAAEKQAVQQVMLDHITKTVSHFKGKVAAWDVINEPLADYDTFDAQTNVYRDNKWLEAMGPNYITLALQTAHAADPQAKLYINDYGLEADGDRWDAFLKMITQLKTAGVPLDGVGFEAHVYDSGDIIDPTVLTEHINQLAALGVTSHISEMDVYDDDGLDVQTKQYVAVFKACLADVSCTSFGTWGVDDRYDVFQDDDGTLDHGNDLLFNDGQATPAELAIQNYLEQQNK